MDELGGGLGCDEAGAAAGAWMAGIRLFVRGMGIVVRAESETCRCQCYAIVLQSMAYEFTRPGPAGAWVAGRGLLERQYARIAYVHIFI